MNEVEDDQYLHVTHIPSVRNQDMPRRNISQRRQGSQDSINDNRGRKYVKTRNMYIVVSVLMVSVMLNAVLGTYLLLRANTSQHQAFGTSEVKAPDEGHEDLSGCMCVLCTSLGMTLEYVRSSRAVDIIINIADGQDLCCRRYSQYLQKLINLRGNVRKKEQVNRLNLHVQFSAQFQTGGGSSVDRHDSLLASSQNSDNSAHLFLNISALRDNRLAWTTEFGYGSAYIGTGIDVLENRIKIKEDGRYFLYSFITFKSRHVSDIHPTIIHTVSRYNQHQEKLGDQLLLFGKISLGRQRGKFRSSYVAAGVVLRADDELWVDVLPLSSVYAYSPANYFGLYRID